MSGVVWVAQSVLPQLLSIAKTHFGYVLSFTPLPQSVPSFLRPVQDATNQKVPLASIQHHRPSWSPQTTPLTYYSSKLTIDVSNKDPQQHALTPPVPQLRYARKKKISSPLEQNEHIFTKMMMMLAAVRRATRGADQRPVRAGYQRKNQVI